MWKMTSSVTLARCGGFIPRAGLLIVFFSTTPLHAQVPQIGQQDHMGVATCAASQCHGSAVPRDGSNVLQNEYVTWTQSDPHSRAYEVLNNELSRAMAARLGLPAAHTAGICLDCHADNVADSQRGERFQISDGVGCEACHGGAEDWLSTHYNVPDVTHADNVNAGLYPTDVVSARADLCLSCHLGTQNKFATHTLMAAGHPRLSFELDTFTELWRTAGNQPHYRIDDDFRQRKTAGSHTYTWAIGLIAEARQRLALVSNAAFTGDNLFPELGLYDCHACHRSMKSVQWRRLPRHGDAQPGSPFINDGTLVMSLALVSAVFPEDAEELRAAITSLHVAGAGNSAEMSAVAANLNGILARLQSRLSESVLRNRARAILDEILSLAAAGNFIDYVSAEQAFMAVQMLAIELNESALEAALEELAQTLEDDEAYRPEQFARLLEEHAAE